MAKQNLVTMAEAKAMLRVDSNDHDPRISLLIAAASANVLQFITEHDPTTWLDANGEPIPGKVPANIKTATLIMLMTIDRNAEENEGELFDRDHLPKAVESLLFMDRKPTLA